ncbi:hypothetical protein FB45DRAFT_942746 [Roridomyces roridus]|uniref:phytol kinase n=1 Tax=Roridomyces roridus TaxID=1738132 RepID=A0AAD7B456_9AGAR|nr:hypothetical protein FB45DRAFT_942746 [Roridomyces roridus]
MASDILPACYGQLDPMQAERFESLDFITTVADAQHLMTVFLAMERLLRVPKIPKGCYSELWSPLWRWSLLVRRHDYCLPQHTRQGFLLTVIQLFAKIHRNCDVTAKAINATPGLRQLVARVWVILSRKTNAICADGARDDILDLLHHGLDIKNPEHLNDLIEGCGGSLVHFADVLVGFFTNLASNNADQSLRLMDGAFSVMGGTMDIRPEFPEVLRGRGFVRALVVMLRRIASHSPSTEYALDEACQGLLSNILPVPSEERIVEAIEAGLLQLIASAMQNPRLISEQLLKFALLDILCTYSVYRSVLARLSSAMVEVDATMDDTLASRSPVWELWIVFRDILSEMANTLRIHRAPNLPPTRACDNIECGLLPGKHDLKCCSRCETVFYCSTDCQRLDWRRGHKRMCAKIRTHFLQSPEIIAMQSSRDESFFRTVAFTAYHNNMAPILLEELSYILRYPDLRLPFVAFLNFDGGGVGIGGLTERNIAFGREIFGPMWYDHIARAAGTRGQNHLQLIFVFCSIESTKRIATHLFAIPKPRGVREALVALAMSGEVPPGVVEVAELNGVPAVTDRIEAIVKDQDLGWLERSGGVIKSGSTPSGLLCAPGEAEPGKIPVG